MRQQDSVAFTYDVGVFGRTAQELVAHVATYHACAKTQRIGSAANRLEQAGFFFG